SHPQPCARSLSLCEQRRRGRGWISSATPCEFRDARINLRKRSIITAGESLDVCGLLQRLQPTLPHAVQDGFDSGLWRRAVVRLALYRPSLFKVSHTARSAERLIDARLAAAGIAGGPPGEVFDQR